MATISFTCYACNQVLKVGADKGGKKAKCPKCQTVLTIPVGPSEEAVTATPVPASPSAKSAPPPPPLEDQDDRPRKRPRDEDDYDDERPRKRRREDEGDDDDRPRKRRRDEEDDYDEDRPRKRRRDEEEEDDDRPRRRRREEDEDFEDDRSRARSRRDDYDDRPRSTWKDDWPKVKLGSLLAFIGMCVYAGGFGLQLIVYLLFTIGVLGNTGGLGLIRTMDVMVKIALPLQAVALIAAIVGYVFWIFVTNRFGKLAFAIATLASAVVYLIMFTIFQIIPNFETNPLGLRIGFSRTNIAIEILLGILGPAVFMMMAFYTRGAGLTLKDRDLPGRSMLAIIISGVAAGYYLLLYILARAMTTGIPSRGTLILIMMLHWVAYGIMVFVLVLTLVNLSNTKNAADR